MEVWIKKVAGKWTEASQKDLRKLFDALPEGWSRLLYEPKRQYTKSRYKYYFDCVLREILLKAGHRYKLVSPTTGDTRSPKDTTELHKVMKAIYNPIVLVTEDNKTRVISGSTTDLNDSEFIEEYLEQILVDHSSPPYNLEITGYEEWKELKVAGQYEPV